MVIEIIIDSTVKTVTKQELFGLVASGKISADTPVNVDGKLLVAETAITTDSSETVRSSSSDFASQVRKKQ